MYFFTTSFTASHFSVSPLIYVPIVYWLIHFTFYSFTSFFLLGNLDTHLLASAEFESALLFRL